MMLASSAALPEQHEEEVHEECTAERVEEGWRNGRDGSSGWNVEGVGGVVSFWVVSLGGIWVVVSFWVVSLGGISGWYLWVVSG
jgi:hypothetical protein